MFCEALSPAIISFGSACADVFVHSRRFLVLPLLNLAIFVQLFHILFMYNYILVFCLIIARIVEIAR